MAWGDQVGIKTLFAKVCLARASSRLAGKPVALPLAVIGKSLLVLLPSQQRDLTIIKQVLPDITRLFGEDRIYLLANPGTEVESIFPSKGFHIISPAPSSANWLRLPSQTFLDKLKKHAFDYIFDTNLEENLFASRILLSFPDAVRFGANGRLGHPFLNLEIKTKYSRDRHLIYASILEVIAQIVEPVPADAS